MSTPKILILCTGNSCRSHMAEGILRAATGDLLDVHSAGSQPAGYVHPKAIAALEEIGIDISRHESKHMNEFLEQEIDTVITVCGNADQACPVFPGQAHRYHWGFEDPADATGSEEEIMIAFRSVRDQIKLVFEAYAAGYRNAKLTRPMNPITFHPLHMTRVWGGRSLETVYGRSLPDDQPYGEAWEITDRPAEQSIVTTGPLAGRSLHDLWTNQREEIFGDGLAGERFPLLIKILDARDDLSIQVHPPAGVATSLDGEPKTEMWFIADATPEAQLYIGLKDGTTREQFEAAIKDGSVENHVHAVRPKVGESIFIPSGRLHAIGAGLLIYEIQQNSDTTYRVFDWNRVGLDGEPRQLHIEESMQCIDFDDHEPGMDQPDGNILARCEYFRVDKIDLKDGESIGNPDPARFSIVTVVTGALDGTDGTDGTTHQPGQFILLPRGGTPLTAHGPATVLQTTIPA